VAGGGGSGRPTGDTQGTYPPIMPCSTSFRSLHTMRDTNTSTRSVSDTLTPPLSPPPPPPPPPRLLLLLPPPPFFSSSASSPRLRESVLGPAVDSGTDPGPSGRSGAPRESPPLPAGCGCGCACDDCDCDCNCDCDGGGACACGCPDRSPPLVVVSPRSGMAPSSDLVAAAPPPPTAATGGCRSGVADREPPPNIPLIALDIEPMIPFRSGVGSRESVDAVDDGLASGPGDGAPFRGDPIPSAANIYSASSACRRDEDPADSFLYVQEVDAPHRPTVTGGTFFWVTYLTSV